MGTAIGVDGSDASKTLRCSYFPDRVRSVHKARAVMQAQYHECPACRIGAVRVRDGWGDSVWLFACIALFQAPSAISAVRPRYPASRPTARMAADSIHCHDLERQGLPRVLRLRARAPLLPARRQRNVAAARGPCMIEARAQFQPWCPRGRRRYLRGRSGPKTRPADAPAWTGTGSPRP